MGVIAALQASRSVLLGVDDADVVGRGNLLILIQKLIESRGSGEQLPTQM